MHTLPHALFKQFANVLNFVTPFGCCVRHVFAQDCVAQPLMQLRSALHSASALHDESEDAHVPDCALAMQSSHTCCEPTHLPLLHWSVLAQALSQVPWSERFLALKDLAPVSMFCFNPIAMVAHPSVGAASFQDLLSRAKADGKPLPFGTSGNGTAMHLAGELLKQTTGLPLEHVGYKGSAPAVSDIVGGQVPLGLLDLATTKPLIASGKLKAIGVTSAARSATAPEIPTIAESGVPGYESTSWFTVAAPAKVPAAIVQKVNGDINNMLKAPEWRAKLAELGMSPVGGPPEG